MDENKNNSAWILCPSKRFPGKFYYYNVLNGEAAWCFNDIERKYPKKDEKFQRVTDKCHSFPEPNSTPDESLNTSTNTKTSTLINRTCHPQISQMPFTNNCEGFGQPSRMVLSVNNSERFSQSSHMLSSMNKSERFGQPSHMLSSMNKPERFDRPSHMVLSENNSERFGQSSHMLSSMNKPERLSQSSHMMSSMNEPERFNQSSHMMSSMNKPERFDQPSHTVFTYGYSKRFGQSSHNMLSSMNKPERFDQSSCILPSLSNSERFGQTSHVPLCMNHTDRYNQTSYVPSSMNNAEGFGQTSHILSSINHSNSQPINTSSMNHGVTFGQASHTSSAKNSERFSQTTQISPVKNAQIYDQAGHILTFNKNCQLQTFGQAVFPSYISNQIPLIPNVIWTPMPMIMDNTPIVKQELDQKTQTDDDIFITLKSYTIPLSERFAKNNQLNTTYVTSIPQNTTNKLLGNDKKQNIFDVGSSEKINEIGTIKVDKRPKFVMRNPMFNIEKTQPSSHIEDENGYVINRKRIFENTAVMTELTVKNNITEEKALSNFNLDSLDLRYILEAKKKKSDVGSRSVENKKEFIPKITPKKKVSFNLNDSEDNHSDILINDTEPIYNINTPSDLSKILKNLKHPATRDTWYIVVDIEVLINDYTFIASLVQQGEHIYLQVATAGCSILFLTVCSLSLKMSKSFISCEHIYLQVATAGCSILFLTVCSLSLKMSKSFISYASCRLLIPEALRRDIRKMCIGEHSGNSRVMAARQLYRTLGDRQEHIHVEPFEFEEMNMAAIEVIINCCVRLSNKNHLVVIITQDNDLYSKASLYGLHVFTMEEINEIIKDNTVNVDEVNITADPNEKHDNLFLQKTNVFDPFALSKSKLYPNTFKTHFDRNHDMFTFKNNTDDCYADDISYEISKIAAKLNINEENTTGSEITNVFGKTNRNGPNTKDYKLTDYRIKKTRNNSNFKSDTESIKLFGSNIRKSIVNYNHNQKLDLKKCSDQIEHSNVRDLNFNLNRDFTDNVNSLSAFDEKLKRFHIKNKTMYENVSRRLDEYICCFTQIMENCLERILQEHSSSYSPWSFLLALDSIRTKYDDHPSVVEIVDKIIKFGEFNSKNGYINVNINPSELMMTIGCGFLLLEYFRGILDSKDISEAIDALSNLIHNMEKPLEFQQPEKSQSPICREVEDTTRRNFVKEPSEIINYLVNHFPEWRESHRNNENTDHFIAEKAKYKQPLILRTCGSVAIKIDSKKYMYIEGTEKDLLKDKKDNTQSNIDKFDYILHENKFDSGNKNEKNKPKVIRNFNVVDKFEARLNSKCDNNINDIDIFNDRILEEKIDSTNDSKYNDRMLVEEIDDINRHDTFNDIQPAFNDRVLDKTIDYINKDDKLNDIRTSTNINAHYSDKFNDRNAKEMDEKIDIDSSFDNSTRDGGFENESQQAYQLIRRFLMELSATFKIIYTFIEESISELLENNIAEDAKRILYDKTNRTHAHMTHIIQKFKSIIERETIEGRTLRVLLAKAGCDASEDKRVTRYRQVVKKCLEQAKILENSLKIMLNLSNEDCNLSISTLCDMAYFNIFE